MPGVGADWDSRHIPLAVEVCECVCECVSVCVCVCVCGIQELKLFDSAHRLITATSSSFTAIDPRVSPPLR